MPSYVVKANMRDPSHNDGFVFGYEIDVWRQSASRSATRFWGARIRRQGAKTPQTNSRGVVTRVDAVHREARPFARPTQRVRHGGQTRSGEPRRGAAPEGGAEAVAHRSRRLCAQAKELRLQTLPATTPERRNTWEFPTERRRSSTPTFRGKRQRRLQPRLQQVGSRAHRAGASIRRWRVFASTAGRVNSSGKNSLRPQSSCRFA